MLKRYYQVFGSVLLASDVLGLSGSWLFAYYLRFYTQIIPVTKGVPPFSRQLAMLIPVLFVWVGVFAYYRLYGSQKIMRRTTEFWNCIKAQIVALSLFLVLTYVFSEYTFSRLTMGFFGALSGVYLVSTRMVLRNFLRGWLTDPSRKKQAVIIGQGRTARELAERVERMPELGIFFNGYFASEKGQEFSKLPYLGSIAELFGYCEKRSPDEIFIALPRAEAGMESELISRLNKMSSHVHVIPDVYDYMVLGCNVESFDQLPMISINESPIYGAAFFMKRVSDVVISLLALMILLPVLLLIAFLVKLTSRGPIFYGQERMGIDGYTFKMWKFRSMKVDAEKETGAVWAKPNDDRRTKIGAFLRSSSLDELPQLWNVLMGEMSLVGPRPERPQFVHEFRNSVPAYMLRHRVKAGITGWAQVNGWRGDTSLEKRVEFDLYYIRNWSLYFDFKILLLTVVRGFVNKNAY